MSFTAPSSTRCRLLLLVLSFLTRVVYYSAVFFLPSERVCKIHSGFLCRAALFSPLAGAEEYTRFTCDWNFIKISLIYKITRERERERERKSAIFRSAYIIALYVLCILDALGRDLQRTLIKSLFENCIASIKCYALDSLFLSLDYFVYFE